MEEYRPSMVDDAWTRCGSSVQRLSFGAHTTTKKALPSVRTIFAFSRKKFLIKKGCQVHPISHFSTVPPWGKNMSVDCIWNRPFRSLSLHTLVHLTFAVIHVELDGKCHTRTVFWSELMVNCAESGCYQRRRLRILASTKLRIKQSRVFLIALE
jgi:hypothetical protein